MAQRNACMLLLLVGLTLVSTQTTHDASYWTTSFLTDTPPVDVYSTIRFPDVNGDGRSDICWRRPANGILCALSSGSVFSTPRAWNPDVITQFSNTNGWQSSPSYYGTIRFPDLNGDGKADVCGRGGAGVWCGLSNGNSFAPVTLWQRDPSSAFSDGNGWNTEQYYGTISYADVNGDGLLDLCGRGSSGIYCALNLGTRFGSSALWINYQYSDAAGWNTASHYSTIRFIDVNGDGKADVCGRGRGGIICAISTGASFVNDHLWTTQYSDSAGWNSPKYYSTIQFADINKDGFIDICGRGSGGW